MEVFLTVLRRLLFIFCLIFTAFSFAHTKLQSTIPSDQSILIDSPALIALNFNKAVNLIKLTLKDSNNNKVKIDFTPSKNKNSNFNVPLSNKLSQGIYSVAWTIIGADGHKVKGDFSFTLKSTE